MSDLRNDKKHGAGKGQISLKQILAWIAIIFLVGMYVLTLVCSLLDSSLAQQMFRASLFCTVFIPVISWVFIMTVNLVKGSGEKEKEE